MSAVSINIGHVDRVFRIVLGLAFAMAPFMLPVLALPSHIGFSVFLVGLILTLTAIVGFCPLYRVVGFRS